MRETTKNYVWVVERYDENKGWIPVALHLTRRSARAWGLSTRSYMKLRIRKYYRPESNQTIVFIQRGYATLAELGQALSKLR